MMHETSSMKQLLSSLLLGASLFVSATLTPAQEATPTPPPSDREPRKQAERERKEAERRRRDEEKEASRQQGVRCQRLRRTG